MKYLYYILFASFFFAFTEAAECNDNYSSLLSGITITEGYKSGDNKILSDNTLDFGFVRIGSKEYRDFIITNNNNEDLEISKIYIKNGSNSIFKIESIYSLPMNFTKGSKLPLKLSFSPDKIDLFSDELIIQFSKPISTSFTVKLQGSSIAYNLVWVPDLSGIVGSESFKIPVYIKLLDQVTGSNLKFRMTLRFNSELFFPTSVSQGTIIDNYIQNGRRILTIEGTLQKLLTADVLLTEITGLVLMGRTDFTSVEILSFSWDSDWFISITKNGSLRTGGVCQNTLSAIQLSKLSTLVVQPNPAAEYCNLTFNYYPAGMYNFKVFSLAGNLVFESTIEYKSAPKELSFDMRNMQSGSYFLLVTTPHDVQMLPVSVIK